MDKFSQEFSMVNIPSKGEFYSHKKEFLLIKRLTPKEERLLMDNQFMKTAEGLEILLKSIILDDIDVKELLSGDVQAISLYTMSTSFGDSTEIETLCSHCQKKNTNIILFSEFKIKNIKQKPDENMIIHATLPVSGLKVSIRIPNFFDEIKLSKKTFVEKLENTIVAINEEKDYKENIKNWSIKDSNYIKKFLKENSPGVDMSRSFKCAHCSKDYTKEFSSDHNFLTLPETYQDVLDSEMALLSFHNSGIGWNDINSMSIARRRAILRKTIEIAKKFNGQKDDESGIKNKMKYASGRTESK